MTSIAHRLSEASSSITMDDETTHSAVRCVIDWTACAIGGAGHPATTAVARTVETIGTGEQATIIGRGSRASAYAAALINGAASHVLDFDDVNVAMIGHPGVVVISAALAAAESADARGVELLAGIASGYEVAAGLGRLVNPEHYERGWHATGTLGTLAAAVACARVAGADVASTARVLTVAATSAGGIRAVFGSHGKAFNAGRAASAGLLADALVRAGLDVPEDALQGQGGWLGASGGLSRSIDGDEAVGRPAIVDTAVKGHAACGATHCLIDAVAGLVRDEGVVPDQIERIEARVHPLAMRAAGNPAPTTGLEAKFSLRHTAAMAAFEYPLLQGAFTGEKVRRPDVVGLRERVVISVDEKFRYVEAMPAGVRLICRDGTTFERFVDTPRGRPGNPMSDEELEQKFLSLASPVIGPERAQGALQALWAIAAATDLRTVMGWLQP